MLDHLIEEGWLLCGEPDEVAEQVARYQTVGCDQLVFGLPSDSLMEDEVHEMLEVFGTKVIPQFDTDPVHSTTRYRQTAERKYKEFNFPVPDITVEGLPDQRHDPAGRDPHALSAGPRVRLGRGRQGLGPGRARGRAPAKPSTGPLVRPEKPGQEGRPPRIDELVHRGDGVR